MKRLTTLTAILALTLGMAVAQSAFVPGAEFLTAWDLDGDGKVTLAEARERRDSIFYMFDLNGDDQYSADEVAGIDAHKAEEAANGKGVGQRGGGQMLGQTGQLGQGFAQAPNAAILPGQGGMGRGQAGHQGQRFAQAPGGAGVAIQPGQGRGMGHGAGRGQMMQAAMHQPGAMQPGAMQPGAGRGQMLGQTQALGQTPMQPGAGRGQMQGQGFAAATGTQGTNALALAGTATELLGFDTDGNGIITRAEFVDGTPVWFAQRDRNGDGVITTADFGNGRF